MSFERTPNKSKFEGIDSASELLRYEQQRIIAIEESAQDRVQARDTAGHHEELRTKAVVYASLPLVVEAFAREVYDDNPPKEFDELVQEVNFIAMVAEEALEHNDFDHLSNVFCNKESMHSSLSILERLARDYEGLK